MRDDTIESVAEQSARMQPSINVHATYLDHSSTWKPQVRHPWRSRDALNTNSNAGPAESSGLGFLASCN